VVVNAEGDVLYIHGRTGYFLEPAPGEASLNVLRMAREGLRLELTTALRKASTTQDKVVQADLAVRTNGGFQNITLTVRPIPEAPIPGLYLVVFEPTSTHVQAESQAVETHGGSSGDKDQRISILERDLRAKEEYLQTTIEELETSNEELTSTNEELQSANEELQSTNEELETSKEELQSVNEELMTVNMELQKKIDELSRANNDLSNLLAGTGIGTVFVDHQMRIQRFTPAATEIINLIQADVGRPVSHIVANLQDYTDLIKDVMAVLDTLTPKEREVQGRNGRWYLMRMQPYRTLENVIEGAVITFVDISSQKKMLAALEESRRLSLESMFDPALIVQGGGKVVDCNDDALNLLGYTTEEVRDLRLADLVPPEAYWKLRAAMEEAERGQVSTLQLKVWKKGRVEAPVQVRVRPVNSGMEGVATVMVLQAL
jgi:two-component system CheB/CheR fusion protein